MAAQIDEIFPAYTGTALNRGLSQTDFDDAEEYFQGYHADFVPTINTWRTEANALSTAVNGYSVDALASADAAALSALQAASVVNSKGAWANLTGALNIPASVTHTNSTWSLNVNLADVTLSEPTAINTDWTEVSGVTQAELDLKENITDNDIKLALKANLTGANFTGLVGLNRSADVASATVLPIPVNGNSADVTGTATVTSIATTGKLGAKLTYHFDGILTLTHHATDLILPSGENIITAAGDIAEFEEYASGDYRCNYYTRADGTAVVAGGLTTTSEAQTKIGDLTIGESIGVDSWSFSGTTITINTSAVHNLIVGQYFSVDGLVATTNAPNGRWVAATVEDTDTITFTATATPTGSPTVSSATLKHGDIEAKGAFLGVNAITAFGLSDASGNIIKDNFNLGSIVRDSAGDYTISFHEAMDTANYVVVVSVYNPDAFRNVKVRDDLTYDVNGFKVTTTNIGGTHTDTSFSFHVTGGKA